MTNFSSADEADAYSKAYSKALARKIPRKKVEFFGDADHWQHPKQEWTEDTNPPGHGPYRGIDPLQKAIKPTIPGRWLGGM